MSPSIRPPRPHLPRRSAPAAVVSRVSRARARAGPPEASPLVLCLGDLVLDVVASAEAGLQRGTDTPGSLRFRAGGSAANTARVVASTGGRAAFLGAIGPDGVGRRLVGVLRAAGVRVHAPVKEGATARIVVVVEPGGERTFITERGAADELRPDDVTAAALRRVDALHLPAYSLLNEPLAQAAIRAAGLIRGRGGIVSVDLASRAPILAHGRRGTLARLADVAPDLLFANASEARALAGREGEPALLRIAPVVVVKQGAAGCRVLATTADAASGAGEGRRGSTGVMQLAVATRPVPTSDTTGAGDAFDAGFLLSWLRATAADPALREDGARGRAAALRTAAVAGHRAAAGMLTGRRADIDL